MMLTIASGKGGTGKTTVATNLAHSVQQPILLLDCDVEEPNAHLFLKPAITTTTPVYKPIPQVDLEKCTYCGKCAEICEYNALAVIKKNVLVFAELCHGCGGCFLVCPEKALQAITRELGKVSWGSAGAIDFLMGRLRVGEAMSPPLMRAVKKKHQALDPMGLRDVIIDAPPGVSCPAVNAVMDCDIIVLVTEPTPFGLYDLSLAREAFAEMSKPMCVVVNRAGIGDRSIYDYCRDQDLAILAEIPYSRKIAESYSKGQILSETDSAYQTLFRNLADQLRTMTAPSEKELEAVYD